MSGLDHCGSIPEFKVTGVHHLYFHSTFAMAISLSTSPVLGTPSGFSPRHPYTAPKHATTLKRNRGILHASYPVRITEKMRTLKSLGGEMSQKYS